LGESLSISPLCLISTVLPWIISTFLPLTLNQSQDLLVPFGTFSDCEHILWYVHLHSYLNKSCLMGSVAESSLKILHRLLLAFSRLAVTNKVNHDYLQYGNMVWSYITPGSVEFCSKLDPGPVLVPWTLSCVALSGGQVNKP
jgi:hypothetical protein